MSSGDESKGPTVVDLPARNDVQGAVDGIRRNLPAMLEYAGLQAKQRRALFLALIAEGFTEAQALELCWRT